MDSAYIKLLFTFACLNFVSITGFGENDKFQPLLNENFNKEWNSIGPAKWNLNKGILETGQDGDPKRWGILQTNKEYLDFELKLEFKIDEHEKYNSGVYLRRPKDSNNGRAYQVNIGRGASGEPVGLYLNDWLAKGDEYDKIRMPKKWNSLRIQIVKSKIQVWLNRKKIVDFIHGNPKPYLLKPGTIAFQTYGADGHSGWVKFRNIYLKNLSK